MADGTSLTTLGTRPAGFLTYAVVPDPVTRVNYGDAASRFGLQGGFSTQQGTVIPYLGVSLCARQRRRLAALEPRLHRPIRRQSSPRLERRAALPAEESGDGRDHVSRRRVADLFSPPNCDHCASLLGRSGCRDRRNAVHRFWSSQSGGHSGAAWFRLAYAKEVAATTPISRRTTIKSTGSPSCPGASAAHRRSSCKYYQLVYAAIHQADPRPRSRDRPCSPAVRISRK